MNKKRIEQLEDQSQGGEDKLIYLLNQFRQAMDKKDFETALEVRKKAEPIFQANRSFLTAISPDGRRGWCYFLVFICDESRKHLIESLEAGTKPEYDKLYLPYNRGHYPVKFF